MTALSEELVAALRQIAEMGRREAFAAVEELFSRMRDDRQFSAEELKQFFGLVWLVLQRHAPGMTIRITGRKQAAHPRDERLEGNEGFDLALDRTMQFLARNFTTHLEEYEPHRYVIAVLRALAKEYGLVRVAAVETLRISELPAAGEVLEEQTPGIEPPAYLREYERVRDLGRDGEIFYDWFVGSMSRYELARLHRQSLEQIEETLLRVAGAFEQGRLLALVNLLLNLREDGDMLLLFSKGLTGTQIGEKVGKSHWLVYKRLQAIRKRLHHAAYRMVLTAHRLPARTAG
jgi:hypothetical protein